jgi:hypothetical protein
VYGVPTFSSSGAGSVIELSGVTGPVDNTTELEGGIIKYGTGSYPESGVIRDATLDITPQNFAQYDFSQITGIFNSTIIVTGVALNFENLTQFENVQLVIRDASVMNFPALITMRGISFDVSNGCTINFPALTNWGWPTNLHIHNSRLDFPALTTITGSSLVIQASFGSKVNLPKLTSACDYFDVKSEGMGSEIDLSALTAIAGQGSFNANSGGKINLSGVRLNNNNNYYNNITLVSEGFGSEIDLSGLTILDGSVITTNNGGKIRVGSNLTHIVNLSNFTALADFDASTVRSIIDSTILATGMILNFTNVTELRGSEVYADGGVISFPVLQSMVDVFPREEKGGVISFPKLTHWGGEEKYLVVGNGSKLDFPELRTISWDVLRACA